VGIRLGEMLYFVLQEHEKRCWSVDFNHVDPKLLASGSDDAKGNELFVRLLSSTSNNSSPFFTKGWRLE